VSKDQDWDESEKAERRAQKVGPKKDDMYQLIAHDGVRFVKIVMLFANQGAFVKNMREDNKYFLAEGVYFSSGTDSNSSFLVDFPNQIV